MRLYEATADCLVDFVLLHWYVVAKDEKEAWVKAYAHIMKSNVADSGTVDVTRAKEFNKSYTVIK